MSATSILKHEHEVILLALQGAEAQANRLLRGFPEAAATIAEMADFFRNFADRCHHAKEEKLLFPRLEQRGIPNQGGPLGVMLAEHEEGRGYVRTLLAALPAAQAGDRAAARTVASNLLAYVDLLRQHIEKEDHCLFAMADQALTAEDQAELAAAFARVESEEIGAGVHERYHDLAHQWAAAGELEPVHEGGCRACGACKL